MDRKLSSREEESFLVSDSYLEGYVKIIEKKEKTEERHYHEKVLGALGRVVK